MTGGIDDLPGLPEINGPVSPNLGQCGASQIAKAHRLHEQLTFEWGVQQVPSRQTRVPRAEERQEAFRPMPDGPVIAPPPLPVLRHALRDAVERFLKKQNIPYVNVDEAKRALFNDAKLRAFHFVAYGKNGPNWLIFAAQIRRESRDDMEQWEKIFGDGFVAVVASQKADGALHFRTLAGKDISLT